MGEGGGERMLSTVDDNVMSKRGRGKGRVSIVVHVATVAS